LNEENSAKLRTRFPQFYGEGNGFTGRGVLFECRDGWFNLLWKLSEDIEHTLKEHPGSGCNVVQVKQKFGSLRYYCSAPRDVQDLIDDAARVSEETCEECGRAATLQTIKDRVAPYCDACYQKKTQQHTCVPKRGLT